jgi:hypothetical protein
LNFIENNNKKFSHQPVIYSGIFYNSSRDLIAYLYN